MTVEKSWKSWLNQSNVKKCQNSTFRCLHTSKQDRIFSSTENKTKFYEMMLGLQFITEAMVFKDKAEKAFSWSKQKFFLT